MWSSTFGGVDGARVDEAHEIAGLLFGATELTRSRFEELCRRFSMTPVQARALLALGQPAPMRTLAGQLACDPSNVTGIADRLEARGLVRRTTAPEDRRVKLLVPTAKGEEVRDQLEAALLATSPFMAGLSDDERRTLRALLRKITGAGGDDDEAPPGGP